MRYKHFVAIAKVLRYHKDNAGNSTYAELIADLTVLFAHFNPRFKHDLFKADCGVKQEVK
jgi:hypothetical protein